MPKYEVVRHAVVNVSRVIEAESEDEAQSVFEDLFEDTADDRLKDEFQVSDYNWDVIDRVDVFPADD